MLGGYLATQHLIQSGHTQIACVTGPLKRNQAQMRYEGYQQAMQEAGLEMNPAWVVESNFESDGGYDAFQRLYAQKTLPSAVFVCNDMMAMGLINAPQAGEFRFRSNCRSSDMMISISRSI